MFNAIKILNARKFRLLKCIFNSENTFKHKKMQFDTKIH